MPVSSLLGPAATAAKKPTKSKKDGDKEGDDSKRPKSKERPTSAEHKAKGGEKKKKDGKIAAAGTFKTGVGTVNDGLGPSGKKEVSLVLLNARCVLPCVSNAVEQRFC